MGGVVFGLDKLADDKGNVKIIVSDNKKYSEAKATLEGLGFAENIDFYNGWYLSPPYYRDEYNASNWIDYENQFEVDFVNESGWEKRTEFMSRLIPSDVKSVMDIGCGNQRLKKYLVDGVSYYGVDYVQRAEDVLLCDLNKDSLPEINVDMYYMAGVLQYIDEIDRLFHQMRCAKYILFSFNDLVLFERLDAHYYKTCRLAAFAPNNKFLKISDVIDSLAWEGFFIDRAEKIDSYRTQYVYRAKRN